MDPEGKTPFMLFSSWLLPYRSKALRSVSFCMYGSDLLAPGRGAQVALHLLQYTLSYLLMLAVMTYNVGVFVAIVAGAAAGFFLWANRAGEGAEDAGCH